jgi:flagellar hook protein FlgE
VTEQVGIETSGSSPDFTREEFLAHAQVRVIDTMNDYVIDGTGDLGVNGVYLRVLAAVRWPPYTKRLTS